MFLQGNVTMGGNERAIRISLLQIAGIIALSFTLGPTAGLAMEQSPIPSPRIVVKFVEGLEVRLVEGRISGQISSKFEGTEKLQSRGLRSQDVEESFEKLRWLLSCPEIGEVQPQFSNHAQGLQPKGPFPGERNLQLYYSIALRAVTQEQINSLVLELGALPIVEIVYQAPIPQDADMSLPGP